jgi:hypothetical protein
VRSGPSVLITRLPMASGVLNRTSLEDYGDHGNILDLNDYYGYESPYGEREEAYDEDDHDELY